MSASKPSAEHASERLLKLATDFKDVCSTDVVAPSEEKLSNCSKYESAFCRPIQKSASIDCLICSVIMSDLKIYLHCFDCTLKSGTFSVPGMVLPGRGTAWHKSGTSREIRDGWQPYTYWRVHSVTSSLSRFCAPVTSSPCDDFTVWRVHRVTSLLLWQVHCVTSSLVTTVLQFFSEYPAMGVHPFLLEWRGSVMTIGDAR